MWRQLQPANLFLQIKTNKMEYYNIDIDYTPSITGKRDGDVAVAKKKESFSSKEQEKEFNDFFINNYKNKSRVMITDFQLFNTKKIDS